MLSLSIHVGAAHRPKIEALAERLDYVTITLLVFVQWRDSDEVHHLSAGARTL